MRLCNDDEINGLMRDERPSMRPGKKRRSGDAYDENVRHLVPPHKLQDSNQAMLITSLRVSNSGTMPPV